MALEIGQRKFDARNRARKISFYVRLQFLRTLTCVNKNATVQIHLNIQTFYFILCVQRSRNSSDFCLEKGFNRWFVWLHKLSMKLKITSRWNWNINVTVYVTIVIVTAYFRDKNKIYLNLSLLPRTGCAQCFIYRFLWFFSGPNVTSQFSCFLGKRFGIS